jgi:hypothetical protein
MVADAKDYYLPAEDLTRDDIAIKESEGGRIIYIYIGGITGAWGTYDGSLPSRLNAIPVVNEPSTLWVHTHYYLEKREGGDRFILQGGCVDELVYLDIYKNDVVVDDYNAWSDSEGEVKFNVTFRKFGYYAYKVYTKWEKENGKIPAYTHKFYVEPEPTPTPTPTITPSSTSTIQDSDGDGWDDEQERRAGTNPNNVDTDSDGIWDPKDHNPLVASTSTPTTSIPAFQIIPAIVALLAAYLLRRKG